MTLLRDEITHLRADLEAQDGVCTGKHCGVCESDDKNVDIVRSGNGGMGNEGRAGGGGNAGSRSGGRRNGGCKGGGKRGAGGKCSGGKCSGGKCSGGKSSGGKCSGGKCSGGQGSGREATTSATVIAIFAMDIKVELVFVPYISAEAMTMSYAVTRVEVEGARRILGTMRVTSTKSVISTVSTNFFLCLNCHQEKNHLSLGWSD